MAEAAEKLGDQYPPSDLQAEEYAQTKTSDAVADLDALNQSANRYRTALTGEAPPEAPPSPSSPGSEMAQIARQQLQQLQAANQARQAAEQEKARVMGPQYEAAANQIEQTQLPQRPEVPKPIPVPGREQYVDQTAAKSLFAVASAIAALGMMGGRGRGMLAMAGMTGAMQGFQELNAEKYKAGMLQYKEAVQQQLDQYSMAHQGYLDDIQNVKMSWEQRMLALNLRGKALEDKIMVNASQANDIDAVFKHITDLAKTETAMQNTLQKAQMFPIEKRLKEAETKEHEARAQVLSSTGAAGSGGESSGATGEAALAGVDPKIAALVRKVANYEIPISGFGGLDAKTRAVVLPLVAMYDPSFSASEYQTRMALRRDFTSGKAATNIRSINTAVYHLDSLSRAAKDLENGSLQLWNKIANKGLQATGDPRVTKFNAAATAVRNELASVFKGTGATDQEINAWRDNISDSQSPEQLKQGIEQAIELMAGRIQALSQQYETGMGKPKGFKVLYSQSRAILQKLGIDADKIDPSGSGAGGGPVRGPNYRESKDVDGKPIYTNDGVKWNYK